MARVRRAYFGVKGHLLEEVVGVDDGAIWFGAISDEDRLTNTLQIRILFQHKTLNLLNLLIGATLGQSSGLDGEVWQRMMRKKVPLLSLMSTYLAPWTWHIVTSELPCEIK